MTGVGFAIRFEAQIPTPSLLAVIQDLSLLLLKMGLMTVSALWGKARRQRTWLHVEARTVWILCYMKHDQLWTFCGPHPASGLLRKDGSSGTGRFF